VLFHSYIFLFAFLPLVLLGWWGLRGKNPRLAFLMVASWVFYAWWDWRFLSILLITTTVDFVAGRAISATNEERRRKAYLVASLSVNLGILAYFKYAGFFLSSLDGLGSALGLPVDVPIVHVVLPIGISFYTFNSMSYTIDVFRRRIAATPNVLEYSTFVALFPHLIAGPIVRFTEIGDRLRRPLSALNSRIAAVGLFFLACGLAKKLLLADQLGPDVDRLFANAGDLGFVAAWAAALGFSLQLYFDFSGYSDMAVGLAWLLGFSFPQNFDSPYKARNISDFWRRWNMTLSRWIRDYLFIPLGGSRGTLFQTTRNLVVTMALAGLWHGAAWTFVVWGLVHGAFLGGHALLSRAGLTPRNAALNRTITFLLVVAAFVIFRSPDLTTAGQVLGSMVGLGGLGSLDALGTSVPLDFGLLLVALLVFVNAVPNTWEIEFRPRLRYALLVGLVGAAAVMSIARPEPFIYFQF
jgi:alginate O-acetyltransferase complex protein AlgI